ncbi:hypothetical protein C8Q80DRAFT_1191073 [Daedaleopsis nitida]|nr:hypothetical protein C8Q80DRAFT_1191073 [Daedaleopsis nitida]
MLAWASPRLFYTVPERIVLEQSTPPEPSISSHTRLHHVHAMFPYYHYPTTYSDSEYLRALAEERAAREQYAAACRAQEEARQRAARARAARRAYMSPYSSYHDDDRNDLDLDLELDDGAYYPRQRPLSFVDGQRPYGYGLGLNPYSERALLEEQRKRELLELERERERRRLEEQRRRELLELEREKERRRLEEERIRRILQEERQREEAARQKMLEEERLRRAIEEEKLRRAVEDDKLRRALQEEEEVRKERERAQFRSQQASLEPLLRALGFVPASSGSESDSDKVRRHILLRPLDGILTSAKERTGRPSRVQTTSRNPRRNGPPSPSPIRPYPFGGTSKTTPSPTTPNPNPTTSTSTSIPITSPKPAAKTPVPPSQPTPEQIAAAERIQEAYRSHVSRRQAFKSVAALRKRFLAARNGFTLPSTLDYDIPTNGRIPTTVTVDPAAAQSSLDSADLFENVPKLAYTPTNAALHGYEEELNRILSALDAVESRGDLGVRMVRRELARTVESEAERVERWRAVVWNRWTQQQAEQEKASQSVQVDHSSSPAPLSTFTVDAEPVVETVESEEQAMEIEHPEQTVEAPVANEPVSESSTTQDVPMPVEQDPQPASLESSSQTSQLSAPTNSSEGLSPNPTPVAPPVLEEAASPAPEVEITDAEDLAPAIVVDPPSRAEPVDASSTVARVPDAALQEAPTARPPTPALSHEPSEVEMEVEPDEVRTPPQLEHVPLVALDAHSTPQLESAISAAHPTTKEPESLASLPDGDWHDLRTDTF